MWCCGRPSGCQGLSKGCGWAPGSERGACWLTCGPSALPAPAGGAGAGAAAGAGFCRPADGVCLGWVAAAAAGRRPVHRGQRLPISPAPLLPAAAAQDAPHLPCPACRRRTPCPAGARPQVVRPASQRLIVDTAVHKLVRGWAYGSAQRLQAVVGRGAAQGGDHEPIPAMHLPSVRRVRWPGTACTASTRCWRSCPTATPASARRRRAALTWCSAWPTPSPVGGWWVCSGLAGEVCRRGRACKAPSAVTTRSWPTHPPAQPAAPTHPLRSRSDAARRHGGL